MSSYDEFLKAVKSWPSTPSFAVLLILEVIVLKFIWPSSKEDFFLYGLASIIIATSLIWGNCRRIPKKRKNSFGFVVSIFCDDTLTEKKFREDFVKTLKILLKERASGNNFDFIEFKNHISEKVTDKIEALKF